MPQPTSLPPDAEPPPKPATPPETPPPRADAAPKPAGEGAVFHALLDAGVAAKLAYTAEKRMHTMISETGAQQLQPFVTEMNRRFDEQDRRFDEQDRRFDRKLDAVAAEMDRRFDERDRRFDDIDRRLDERNRKLDALAAAGAARDRRLDEQDRKLDVIVARLDGLKLLGQIMIGAYALLITVLIAVFGFLFTNAN